MARKDIPAAHYMMAAFGGMNIRCAPYATFGTPELSAHAVTALEGRAACLLANHGMIACAPTLARALWLAVELETLARQFFHTLLIGGPVLLTPAEISAAARAFSSYGLREHVSPQHSDAAPPAPTRKARGEKRLA
jgi:L-fuculose-phosphate aldolase